MELTNLALRGFRNYSRKVLVFADKTTLVVGDNGVGKTNILEAIYLLATGKSFRASKEAQMILYGKELARVSGDVSEVGLEIMLTTGEVEGQRVARKRYLVNGVAKRRMDFVGNLRCVLFRPEDIELVLGSPRGRRDYLDSVLEQVDREYRRSNLSYQKGVRQRNKILDKIREGEGERRQLLFWDQILIKNGEIVANKRDGFITLVNEELGKRGSDLRLEYDRSVISEARLNKYANREVAAATTLVGPHRDDLAFIIQRKGKAEKDLSIYGSRGEQRMAVLLVKLAELEFVNQASDDKPVLLLDDIFSELDSQHRSEVVKMLDRQQTIITTTDEQAISKKLSKKMELVRLK